MKRLLAVFILLLAPVSSVASKCKLKPDSTYPRKHSIRLPDGRLISILAHSHPRRNDPNASGSQPMRIEGAFSQYFNNYSVKFAGRPEAEVDISRKTLGKMFVKDYLANNKNALKHALEDYKILERSLETHPYGVVGIESDSYSEHPDPQRIVDDCQMLVEAGVLTSEEARAVLLIHLTPAGYLKFKRPDLFKASKIKGLASQRFVNGNQDELKKFCKKHSFGALETTYPEKTVLELLKRFPGESKSIMNHFMKSTSQLYTVDMIKASSTFGKLKPDDFVARFQTVSGIELTSHERSLLHEEAKVFIKAIDSEECHNADYNEVKHLISQKKSLIYSVGEAHLSNFKNYLEAMCRDLRGQTSNEGVPATSQESID